MSYYLNGQQKLLLYFILLTNFIVGLFFLNTLPIGHDEPFSIFHAQMSVSDIIHKLNLGNNPPLYEIVLHFWIKIFGISPISVRFPSLLMGIVTLYLIFKISVEYFNSRVAFTAILLASFSSYLFHLFHEARAYSMFLMLVLLSAYFLFKLVNIFKIKYLIFLFLIYLTMIYTHYFSWWVFFVQCLLFMVCFKLTKKKIVSIIALTLLLILSYFPVLINVLSRLSVAAKEGTWIKPTENLGNLHDAFFWFSNYNRWIYLLFMLLVYGALFLYYKRSDVSTKVKYVIIYCILPLFFITAYSVFFPIPFFWKITSLNGYILFFCATSFLLIFLELYQNFQKNKFTLYLTGFSFISLLSFFIISFWVPIFLDRYLIFTVPFLYILLAVILCSILFSRNWLIFLILLPFMLVFNAMPSNYKEVDKIVEVAVSKRKSDTYILISPEHFSLTFAYHYDWEIFKNTANFNQMLNNESIYPINYIDNLKIDRYKHIILIDADIDGFLPQNNLKEKLSANFKLVDEDIFGNYKILEFKSTN